jgi:ribonucleoside-diphosphate reductase alpha chain
VIRDGFIPGKDKPAFTRRTFAPQFWSQTATTSRAEVLRGKMCSPERETSVKQMIGRVVHTIGGWGRDGGYFSTDEEAETFEAELKAIWSTSTPRSTVPWFNVGFEEAAVLGLLHPRWTTRWSRSSTGSGARESSPRRFGSGVNLARLRSSKSSFQGRYASGPVSFMAAPTPRSADQVGRQDPARREDGAFSTWTTGRRGVHLVQGQEEEKARVLEQAGYDKSSTRRIGPRSSTRTRTRSA